MKHKILTLAAIIATCLLASCAGPNAMLHTPTATGFIPGFWTGLVHGTILPITFFISLFTDNVSIYAVNNSGGWYDFGFVLGIYGIAGGSSK